MTRPTTVTVVDAVETAAQRLRNAAASGRPSLPIRDLIAPGDVASAYAIQRMLVAERVREGAARVGRKIGLTSETVQRQLGVDQPDFGVLLSEMEITDGGLAPMNRLLQPKVEAEIAFGLGADLADGDLSQEQVREAVAWVAPSLEVVDSRIRDWDISFVDTVADNASSALFVLGSARAELDALDPVATSMTMAINGVEVSAGMGSAALGDPLVAVAWLARTARALGDPLRAGEVVLSGALGPMVAVRAGDAVSASFSSLGTVTVRFVDGGGAGR